MAACWRPTWRSSRWRDATPRRGACRAGTCGLHVLFLRQRAVGRRDRLKRLAVERGLLCMGPDAGRRSSTASRGFANAVPCGRGGPGQCGPARACRAVTCGLAWVGVRRVSRLSARAAVTERAGRWANDARRSAGAPGRPGNRRDRIDLQAASADRGRACARADQIIWKPTVVCFLGDDPLPIEAACGLHVTNLTQAAIAAGCSPRATPEDASAKLEQKSAGLIPLAATEQKKLMAGSVRRARPVRGGTFCYEAQLIGGTCRGRSTATPAA